MVQRRFPPAPQCSTLRLATGADIPRIAYLSVLGFKDSEIFRYTRPRYSNFPQDAVASFANLYRAQIRNPHAVVLVTEDECNAEDQCAGTPSTRVVVGVASWILPDNSPRIGQFVAQDAGDPEATLDRDVSMLRQDHFNAVKKDAEQKFLAGHLICDKLVVHPYYRSRGHATVMLQWGLSMAEIDGVDQGVIPSHMGEPVYLGLGYQVVGEVHVPGDDDGEGFSMRVVTYRVKRPGTGA